MKDYNYEEWLAGHATSKTMMEKLERSLIPYELFALMPIRNDRRSAQGKIEYAGNSYNYVLKYAYDCFGHEVYNAVIDAVEIKDSWHNPLLGYNKFKIVMERENIITIYSDHEHYFQQIIDMFEIADVSGLYKNRSVYVNNLLARYILLQLIEKHYPYMQLLTCLNTGDGEKVQVIAANANRTQVFMYAFSKSHAIETARHYDGIARNLTVIYFINQDFEREGNDAVFNTPETKVVSIRQFYNTLPIETLAKRHLERRVLLLVSLLYNEPIRWHADTIERVAMNPPLQTDANLHNIRHRSRKKNTKNKKEEKRGTDTPWYKRIFRTFIEDALNVLHDRPVTYHDILHFLCASNMVNAYINQCNRRNVGHNRYLQRMFRAKLQIAAGIEYLAATKNPSVHITVGDGDDVFVRICNKGCDYQFSFRGFGTEAMQRLYLLRLPKGKYEGYSMQSIATALYQYSYLRRWNLL